MSIKKTLWLILLISMVMLIINLIMDARSTGLSIINSAIKLTRPYELTQDIKFGSQPWQNLDVYSAVDQGRSAPVIILVYGGGWSWGDKSLYHFAADAFTRKGYTVVIPNYIKYPEGKFPQFIEDIATSVAWVESNISEYNGDPDKLFLVGHSAGAHTVALLASDRQYLLNAGANSNNIKGLAGIAGPYNFTPKEPDYIETFGPENYDVMKVMNHIDGNEPAMLLIHAKGDTAVGQFNQTTLAQTISSKGGIVETVLYGNDITHISILLKLHPWFADEVDVANDIHMFFSKFD